MLDIQIKIAIDGFIHEGDRDWSTPSCAMQSFVGQSLDRAHFHFFCVVFVIDT